MAAAIQRKSLDQPDQRMAPALTTADIVRLGEFTFSRNRFEPGWSWSSCVKPAVGGEHCQTRHVGYAISGRLRVKHQDGTEMEFGPGDAMIIEPDHDGWVISDEPYVSIEFSVTPSGGSAA